jgi:heme-degrading monooxygenase HmoA
MFTVVFEVCPGPGRKEEYLALAKQLKPKLESTDGFIDNERFESRRREGWVLSLSTWRDEKAVVRWRTEGEHHGVQEKGRGGVFSDYHLRVCEVTSDTDPPKNIAVKEMRFDTTEVGQAKHLGITEISPKRGAIISADPSSLARHIGLDAQASGLVEHDIFESIYNPGKMLALTSWKTEEECANWAPTAFEDAEKIRHRRVRNVRDYGLFDRREAAQYYPEVLRHLRS